MLNNSTMICGLLMALLIGIKTITWSRVFLVQPGLQQVSAKWKDSGLFWVYEEAREWTRGAYKKKKKTSTILKLDKWTCVWRSRGLGAARLSSELLVWWARSMCWNFSCCSSLSRAEQKHTAVPSLWRKYNLFMPLLPVPLISLPHLPVGRDTGAAVEQQAI